MSGINIQNVLNQLSTLASGADSTQSASYLSDLSNAILQANNLTGVIEYTSKKELPTPIDSSALGTIYFISERADYTADGSFDSTGGVDTYGAFYYAKQLSDLDSGYTRIRTTKDDRSSTSDFYQGTTSGYMSGGRAAPPYSNTIDKWPFASDNNATDVGDLTIARERGAGQSSSASGYTSGGYGPSSNNNRIDKFSFAADGNATDVGDLTGTLRTNAGQSSETHGYTTGGHDGSPFPGDINDIQKFSFSSDGNATDVGDRTITGQGHTGQNSSTSGYSSAGSTGNPPQTTNIIDKFPFATDQNATDVGDLFANANLGSGQSSSTHGYVSGGGTGPTDRETIQKFSFSSDQNATDVGDLLAGAFYLCGQSSNVSGYVSGGNPSPSANVIQKFPFSTDANSTDVGDLTQSRYGGMGQQV